MLPTVALLLVSLLASAGARAQQLPTPSETTSGTQASMPDLGKGAEEVAAHLRQLTGSLSDTAPPDAADRGFPGSEEFRACRKEAR